MTALRALLEETHVRRVAVIDDVFDVVPRTDELSDAGWSTFFDDLGEAGHAQLAGLFPAYETTGREELQTSQPFVEVLWNNKNALPAATALFLDYETTNATELTTLNSLVAALEALDLTCARMGRELTDDAKAADLLFVDLFLGHQQTEADLQRAIRRVMEIMDSRHASPPLVVLMSRSSRLLERKNEFRDAAGLLGSTFRVVSKADLANSEVLETLLWRLANHYEDAKRIAAFVHAWDSGLDRVRKEFVQLLRRLDLPDLAQVQALLLDFEGQSLGEYLLDIADRVLQHQIEGDRGTILAAKELNKIDLRRYPPPHLTGSPNLQDLVHRMIYQHVERLDLSKGNNLVQLQIGDVIRLKDAASQTPTENVFVIVTPACDLVRGTRAEGVLILPGTLKLLSAADWTYGTSMGNKTPVFRAADGAFSWIKWAPKRRTVIPYDSICEDLRAGGKYERIGRMRELYAVELQQSLLADMGRIGQTANPPATFPVTLTLFMVSPEATARSIAIDPLASAVGFVGRDQDSKKVEHLVLGEAACDAFRKTVRTLAADAVYTSARENLAAMQSDFEFFSRFERGLVEAPQKAGKWQEEKSSDGARVLIHVVRNEGVNEGDAVSGNRRNTPFVLKISDLSPDADE